MGDQVKQLVPGEEMSVEITGTLVTRGWYPGTFVEYSTASPVLNKNVLGVVDISDGTGVVPGFLMTGPQHQTFIEQESDMWRSPNLRREYGDFHADLASMNAGGFLEFDEEGLLQRFGSRIVAMNIIPTGIFQWYVFETENVAKRANPAVGADLVYAPGDPLYVSSDGLLTNELETANHVFTGYVVSKTDTDEEGDYVVGTACMLKP